MFFQENKIRDRRTPCHLMPSRLEQRRAVFEVLIANGHVIVLHSVRTQENLAYITLKQLRSRTNSGENKVDGVI